MSAVDVEAVVTGRVVSNLLWWCYPTRSDRRTRCGTLSSPRLRTDSVSSGTKLAGTATPSGPWAIDDLADDLVALLDRLDVAKGTSWDCRWAG
jgi:3-oxoadipate enol-lactonase